MGNASYSHRMKKHQARLKQVTDHVHKKLLNYKTRARNGNRLKSGSVSEYSTFPVESVHGDFFVLFAQARS